MKIAYLILAHNNPNHLNRLVHSISSPNAMVFIHIDKKSNLIDFYRNYGSNVTFLKERTPVYWGDYSQVKATLALMQVAMSSHICFDYFLLLSGSDYPIQSTKYIESFLLTNIGKEFMNLLPMPNDKVGKPISRLTNYRVSELTPSIFRFLIHILIKLNVLPKKRDYKKRFRSIQPFGGSQWWGLSREAIKYILEFVNKEPEIVRFFNNTQCPDEMFFQTILGNSQFKERIHRNLTYTDWSSAGSSPAMIGEKHLELFRLKRRLIVDDLYGKGEVLFARKFNDASDAIIDRLDQLRNEI